MANVQRMADVHFFRISPSFRSKCRSDAGAYKRHQFLPVVAPSKIPFKFKSAPFFPSEYLQHAEYFKHPSVFSDEPLDACEPPPQCIRTTGESFDLLLLRYEYVRRQIQPWSDFFTSNHGRRPNLADVDEASIPWLRIKFIEYLNVRTEVSLQARENKGGTDLLRSLQLHFASTSTLSGRISMRRTDTSADGDRQAPSEDDFVRSRKIRAAKNNRTAESASSANEKASQVKIVKMRSWKARTEQSVLDAYLERLTQPGHIENEQYERISSKMGHPWGTDDSGL